MEKDRRAADVVRANARALQLGAPAVVRPMGVRRFLCDPAAMPPAVSDAGGFDLVFCDPPYRLDDDELALDLAALAALLAPEALVVVERSSRSPEPRWPAGLEPERSRRYGETALHLAGWEG